MSKQRQIYAVYWEQENGMTKIDFIIGDAPREVKRMITEQLLKDLGIGIKLL